MALEVLTGEFALETSGAGGTQTVAISGVTDPKVLILLSAGLTSNTTGANYARVLGFATASEEASIGGVALDGSAKGATTNIRTHGSSVFRQTLTASDTAQEDFTISAFNSEEFVLNKVTVSSARQIKYLVLGGSDITGVHINRITMPTSTGVQGYTGVGLRADLLMALCVGVRASTGYNVRSSPELYSFGVATGAAARWAVGTGIDNVNPGQASRVLATDALIHIPYQDASYLKVDVDAIGSDGYDFNYETLPADARHLDVLAIEGPAFHVGTSTAVTTTPATKDVTTTDVDPVAILLAAIDSTTVDTVVNGDASFALGVGVSSTNRHSIWSGADDASGGNMSASRAHSASQVLVEYTENSGSPSLVRAIDIDSLGTEKFTLDYETVDGNATYVAHLAIGAAPASASPPVASIGVAASGQKVTPPSLDAMWHGAVTDTTFDVSVIFSQAASSAQIQVATDADFASVVFTSSASATSTLAGAGEVVKFQATGLTADTPYYYRPMEGGSPTNEIGQLRTAPTPGTAKSFSVAVVACSHPTLWTPNTTMWDHVAASGAAFVAHLGDLHYSDLDHTDAQSDHRAGILSHLANSKVAEMYRALPMVYTYDDHDFGPNDNDMGTTGFATFSARSVTAYTDMVPHYPQQQPAGGDPHVRGITQSWDWGRVRFIMPDLRAFASISGGTLLGDGGTYNSMDTWDQESWITAEIDDALANDVALVVLMSSRTWKSGTSTYHGWEEKWATYQQELSEYLCDNNVNCLVAVGDGHQIGFDDGLGEDFTNGKGIIPHFMSGPSNHVSLVATGPYEWNSVTQERPTSGSTEHHQFVLLNITDDGTDITWSLSAYNESGTEVVGPVASNDVTPELNFVSATYTPDEDGGTVVLTVEKDWFSPCSCSYATADDTALAGVDYTAVSGTLSWPGVGKLATITVPVADRAGWQGDRTFTVTITAPGDGSATIGSTSVATVTINETDPAELTTGGTIRSKYETEVVAGAHTLTLALLGDTWIAAGTGPVGTTAQSAAIINAITSAQVESGGWNAQIRDVLAADPGTYLERTSNTLLTLTIPATAGYSITANETITPTDIPAASFTNTATTLSSDSFTLREGSPPVSAFSRTLTRGVAFGIASDVTDLHKRYD